MPSAGSAHVDIYPDVKKFGPKLRTQLQQIASTIRPVVHVDVRADRVNTAGTRTTGAGAPPASAAAGGAAPRRAPSDAGALGNLFDLRLKKAIGQLPDLSSSLSGARGRLGMLRSELGDLSSRRIGVDMDTRTAVGMVREIQGELRGLAKSRDVDVRVNAVRAHAELAALRAQVQELDDAKPTIRPQVAGGPAAGKKLKEFSDASPAAMTAVAALVPPAIPLAGAAVGGVAGLLPGATAGLVGLGTVALATIPGLIGVGKALELQRKAADAAGAAIGGTKEQKEAAAAAADDYQAALDALSPHAVEVMEAFTGLQTAFDDWQSRLQFATMPPLVKGMGVAEDVLSDLTLTTVGAARGLDNLMVSAEKGFGSPYWYRFTSFTERSAEPTLTSLGRTLGWVALGVTGLSVSFEPLWARMSAGMERGAKSFADWANEADNFTGFIAWTTENGPVLLGVLGDIGGAAIDLGVAIAPLGMVYAQGIGYLAQGISWLAEEAPGLLRLAVAAYTLKMGLELLSRVNTGLIQPLRELPGRVRDYAESLRTADTAATTAATSSGRFRGAISGALGVLGGPWGIALGVGITALTAWAAAKQEAKQKTEEYTSALRSDTGAIGENMRATAAATLEKSGLYKEAERLGYGIEQVTEAVLGEGRAMNEIISDIDARIAAYDEMYDQGEITEQQWAGHVTELMNLKGALEEESGAVEGSKEAYERYQIATGGAQTAQSEMNTALAEGAANARDLKTALDELTSGTLNVTTAEGDLQEALIETNATFAANGLTLDQSTEAGRENHDSLVALKERANELTGAVYEQSGSMAQAIVQSRKNREEFIRNAIQMGYTEKAASDLADEYLGLDGEVEMSIIARATGKWSVPNSADMSPSNGQSQFFSTGGPVHGPGTKTSDSINARLSDGEFVQQARAVDRYGVGFMTALNEGWINPAELPGFAKGGYFRTTSRTGSDAAAQINDHREDVRVEIQRMIMELTNNIGRTMAGQMKKAMSEGGNAAVARAMSQRGVPYSWGGGGPSGPSRGFGRGANTVGFDCSSLMQYAWWPQVQLPRVTYSQINSGQAVSRSQAIPGDLMFPHLGHVTMYAGSGRMIHAPRTGDVVRMAPAYANPIAVRRPTRRARGGPVGSDQWSWVGEEGPELVRFKSPGHVYSTQQSARIAAEARATTQVLDRPGQAAPIAVTVNTRGGGDTVEDVADGVVRGMRLTEIGGLYPRWEG